MSTAVASIQPDQYTPEQLKLITSVVAKNATPDELQLFLQRCKLMGLNPLKPGQIHFVKYGTGPGSIVIGIEGFRSIAARTGKLSGIKRGAIRDEKGTLTGAWAEVFRSDWTNPAREEVPLIEYLGQSPIWKKMPETMIKKVAECAALRMAFPDDLGGIYGQEEMDQAVNPGVTPNAYGGPAENDGVDPSEQSYRIPFGKFARRALEEVDSKDLANYVDWLEGDAKKKGKPIQGQVADFIARVDAYLGALENAPIEGETA